MSFSNTIQASGAPLHFERIAKNLLQKRKQLDFSTCDLRIELANGFDMVHSVVVCAHSATLCSILENVRAPYSPFDMSSFDESSVRRIFDWMYSGEIQVPNFSLKKDLAVAAHLRVSMLQRQFENHLRSMAEKGSCIYALNVASAESFSVTDETINYIVAVFLRNVANLSKSDISSISYNSIIAIMTSMMSVEKKVPLVNMAFKWMDLKRANRAASSTIVQSIVISDMTYDALGSIKKELTKQLNRKDGLSRVTMAISEEGRVCLQYSNKPLKESAEDVESGVKKLAKLPKRTQSELSVIEKMPDPFAKEFQIHDGFAEKQNFGIAGLRYTNSEIKFVNSIRDPFTKSKKSSKSNNSRGKSLPKIGSSQLSKKLDSSSKTRSSSVSTRRLPKKFTKSEINFIKNIRDPFKTTKSQQDVLNNIEDPFSKATRIPKFAKAECVLNKSKSEIEALNNIQDPFIRVPSPCDFDTCPPTETTSRTSSRTSTEPRLRLTKSDIITLNNIPDPFVRMSESTASQKVSSARSQNSVYCRETTGGFPKYFTKSEVSMLRNMDDPFASAYKTDETPNEKNPSQPGCFNLQQETGFANARKVPYKCMRSSKKCRKQGSDEALPLKHTFSEIEEVNKMPDPFAPVIMSPFRGCVTNPSSSGSSCDRISAKMPSNYRPDFIVSSDSMSSRSDKKVGRGNRAFGGGYDTSQYLYPR